VRRAPSLHPLHPYLVRYVSFTNQSLVVLVGVVFSCRAKYDFLLVLHGVVKWV